MGGLDPRSLNRIAVTVRRAEDTPRFPTPEICSPNRTQPMVQLVSPTGELVESSGMYPAVWRKYDSATGLFSEQAACWIIEPNMQTLIIGGVYLGRCVATHPDDGAPVYAVVSTGLEESGSGSGADPGDELIPITFVADICYDADCFNGGGSGSDHDPVTLEGEPDYITIEGQAITRHLIDLESHITGILPDDHLPTTAQLIAASSVSWDWYTISDSDYSSLTLTRARAATSDMANGDLIGLLDFVGRANSSNQSMASVFSRYTGNGATTDASVEVWIDSGSGLSEVFKIADETIYLSTQADGPSVLILTNGSKAVTTVSPSDAGKVLTSNGTGANPSFQDLPQPVPAGVMFDFGGTSAPSGYLACDGSAVSRATYAALFAAIGTNWGAGNGSTTFNLPDFRRRTAVGSGGTGTGTLANTVGSVGGSETHTLTTAEMPSHNHNINYAAVNVVAGAAPINQVVGSGSTTPTSSTGSGNAHNNMQPSAVTLKIIKT